MNKGIVFIKNGEIEEAFNWAEEILTSYSKITNSLEANEGLDNIYTLRGRYKKLQKEIMQGIIRKEDEEINYNKLQDALLKLIKNIPNWVLENRFEIEEDFAFTISNLTLAKNNIQIIKRIQEYVEQITKIYSISANLNFFERLTSLNNACIGIIGEFCSGKSSLINALIEREIMPTSATASYHGVLILEWGKNEYLEISENGLAGVRYEINEIESILAKEDEEYRNEQRFNPNKIIKIVLNENFLTDKRIIEFSPTNFAGNIPNYRNNELQKILTSHCDVILYIENSLHIGTFVKIEEIEFLRKLFGDNCAVIVNRIDLLKNNEFELINNRARELYGENTFFISCKKSMKNIDLDRLKVFIKNSSDSFNVKYKLFLSELIDLLLKIKALIELEAEVNQILNNSIHLQSKYTLHYIDKLIFELKISHEIVKNKVKK